ncbi:MAG: Acetolactate synthase large subunit, partial [uncultured Solirubrobacterales bacterium]
CELSMPSSSPSRPRASTRYSAFREARTCRPTTRSTTAACATCSAVTRPAPDTPPRATPRRAAASAWRWPRGG